MTRRDTKQPPCALSATQYRSAFCRVRQAEDSGKRAVVMIMQGFRRRRMCQARDSDNANKKL